MEMEDGASPEALRALAARHGVTATLHRADRPMLTVQEAAEALGIRPDEMTKNILFLVEGQPALAIARGEGQVDRRALARVFGVGRKRVKLATAEETLAITGFAAGCVPSFGHRAPLPTFLDESIPALERVYGGSGDPQVLISLAPADLLRLTRATLLPLGYPDPPGDTRE